MTNKSIEKYVLNDLHPLYGKCVAMGYRDGEPYRMFIKDLVVSLIPVDRVNLFTRISRASERFCC